jgi:PAS domain S-box-containing protein
MEELRGLTPLDLKIDFDSESLAEGLAPLRSGARQTLIAATRYRRKDGTLYPVEEHLQLSRLDSARVFVAIALDTTARVEAEKNLLESERRLRVMVENLPAGAVYLEGDLIYFNRTAEEIIGYERDEIRSIDEWFARLYGDCAAAVRAKYEEAREANFPAPRTHELTRKDGSARLVEFSSYRHDAGEVWLMHDVTERERAQEELRKTEEGMRVAEQLASLGTLTAGIAHDVGTPMNVILGYAQMMESSEPNEKNRGRLRTIREQAQRVTALIQTLLNFARPRELMLASVDLAGELETALSFLEQQFRERGIAVDRRFELVPVIRGDRDRLQQLFLNLFVNAEDAMPDGGELRLTLRVGEPGKVEIRIADTGMGIPEESLESIFEPFFTTKDRGKGTGLGLLVSKGIVVDHGGAISVSSEVGKGTEFRILLPAADASC